MVSTFCSEFVFKPQVFHSNSERSSSFDRVLSEVDFDPDMKGIIYLFILLTQLFQMQSMKEVKTEGGREQHTELYTQYDSMWSFSWQQ